jgi:hypothetical protein
LPTAYRQEFDLAVIMDLFLDIFRYNRAKKVMIDSAHIVKEAKKNGIDNYKL